MAKRRYLTKSRFKLATECPTKLFYTGKSEYANQNLDDSFHIRIVEIDGPFFFGSTSQVVGQIGDMLGTKIVIFDCTKVPFIDLSAFFALTEIILKLKERAIMPFVVVNEDIKEKLLRLDMASILRPDHIFLDLGQTVEHARRHVCENRP